MNRLSNLPPGVTDQMIENAQEGGDEFPAHTPEDVAAIKANVMSAALDSGWDGQKYPTGKHEGNAFDAPYWYSVIVMDGCGETIGIWECQSVLPEEREALKIPEEITTVALREDENGFVHVRMWTDKQYEDHCAEVQYDRDHE